MSAHPRRSSASGARRAQRRRRRGRAGVTLLELLVAAAIMSMMALMIFTAFEHTGRMRERLSHRQERDHVARMAIAKISRDLRSAFLSAHVNLTQGTRSTLTAFVGKDESQGDRLDFTTFTHRRLMRHAHEGDACEVGYRVEQRRTEYGIKDLLRRESPRIDDEPTRGGVLDVLVPDVADFQLRYFDPSTDTWKDDWDSTQVSGNPNRLPHRVRIILKLNERERGRPTVERIYRSDVLPIMLDPLRFGLPIDYR